MSTLLTTYSITTIILVLVIAIPAIIKAVQWIINLFKKHKANQQEAFDQGYDAAQEDEQIEERFEAGENFMKKLGEREDSLEKIMQAQQEEIGLLRTAVDTLTRSDNLNIKHDIKRAWIKVTKFNQSIDYHDLEVLNDRFKIYTERGGNSWAKKMMEEINEKATITSPEKQDQDK